MQFYIYVGVMISKNMAENSVLATAVHKGTLGLQKVVCATREILLI